MFFRGISTIHVAFFAKDKFKDKFFKIFSTHHPQKLQDSRVDCWYVPDPNQPCVWPRSVIWMEPSVQSCRAKLPMSNGLSSRHKRRNSPKP